jgi:hypothetical protein
MELGDLRNERDANGELTAMALAIQSIIDTGCECEEEERHTCIAGRCERAQSSIPRVLPVTGMCLSLKN